VEDFHHTRHELHDNFPTLPFASRPQLRWRDSNQFDFVVICRSLQTFVSRSIVSLVIRLSSVISLVMSSISCPVGRCATVGNSCRGSVG